MSYDMTPVSMSNLRIDGNKLYIKREDLLPFSFGRNKVRIAEKFIDVRVPALWIQVGGEIRRSQNGRRQKFPGND